LDGYWKLELNKSIKALRFWRKAAGRVWGKRLEHQVNREILYSAVIDRKIIEDEKWAEKEIFTTLLPMPPFAILHSEITVMEYPFTGGKERVLHHAVIADYGTDNRIRITMPLEHACNSIIHAYVWDLVHWSEKKDIAGFLVASDRFKCRCLYFFSLDDWLEKLQFCLDNVFNSLIQD
jgi:hypothetical protein